MASLQIQEFPGLVSPETWPTFAFNIAIHLFFLCQFLECQFLQRECNHNPLAHLYTYRSCNSHLV